MENPIKYIARFHIETQAPLAIGAGRSGLLNERLIARDANGLPFIPGTSLAGVVRHELERDHSIQAEVNRLFGYQALKKNEGQGSRIVFSSGVLISKDGSTAIEGLQEVDKDDAYLAYFKNLPQRDHVRINHRGVAAKTGKFEEQLVHRGTRFCFELELEGTKEDQSLWNQVLEILNRPILRIGAGTRKGFGEWKVLSCLRRCFDLNVTADLKDYLNRSSSLNSSTEGWMPFESKSVAEGWMHYQIHLKPESFFLFGSGLWDKNADSTPKKEKCFVWESEKDPKLQEYYLIPATSIKGAIAHRTAFHYSKAKGVSVEQLMDTYQPTPFPIVQALEALIEAQLSDQIENLSYGRDSPLWRSLENNIQSLSIEDSEMWKAYRNSVEDKKAEAWYESLPVGRQNEAVKHLFGFAKNDDEGAKGARGRILFSDLFFPTEDAEVKYFNHVSIDRFTGGAKEGALFTQQVVTLKKDITIDVFVEPNTFSDETFKKAFEATLDDLCSGCLQLGGNSAKGHGGFIGNWEPQN